jgi:predicted nucleic acid-binding protein
MKQVIYFDTSALAKWYLPEEQSNEVEKYIQEHGPVVISELTVLEMRNLLVSHRRKGTLDPNTEIKVFATFEEDIRQKFLICCPLSDGVIRGAINLLSVLCDLPLRMVDAMHLAMAKEIQTDVLATADPVMADAGEKLGLSVVRFSGPEIQSTPIPGKEVP